jgi:hypothetical protein
MCLHVVLLEQAVWRLGGRVNRPKAHLLGGLFTRARADGQRAIGGCLLLNPVKEMVLQHRQVPRQRDEVRRRFRT